MPKFRKKPVVIEARCWSGDFNDWHAMYDFCRVPSPTSVSGSTSVLTGPHPLLDSDTSGKLRVSLETLEGCMFAEPGDWIIRGIKGEFYPCKPDIFDATYEPVNEAMADLRSAEAELFPMTDKLKLFKVRLASGVTRAVVAPDLAAVAQLRFDRPPDAALAATDDVVLGVDYALDVDFVVLREPPAEPKPAHENPPDPNPHGLPSEARSTWAVGDSCPSCGGRLHATLGQLVCSLGHQYGPAPRDLAAEGNDHLAKVRELAEFENARLERQRLPHGLGCECRACIKEISRGL